MSEKKKCLILKPEDCLKDMLHGLKHGKEKGSTTHISVIDSCWTWRKREFNIWTGYANEGKSLFLRYLALIKAVMSDWKFLFSAPEDFPAEEFYDDMIHTLAGLPTDKDHPLCINKEAYMEAYNLIKDKFTFVYLTPPDNTIEEVLSEFDNLIKETKVDACILDPLIKFARPKDMDRDDRYAQYVTTLCTDFARTHDVSLHLVMHQLTPKIQETGKYPKPNMYSIKGGGTWSDGTDNILSIWRPDYASNKLGTDVIFSSQKIKKQKLVGIPQELQLKFNRRSNRYVDQDDRDLFDFKKMYKRA